MGCSCLGMMGGRGGAEGFSSMACPVRVEVVRVCGNETKKPFQTGYFSDSRIRQVSNSPGSAPTMLSKTRHRSALGLLYGPIGSTLTPLLEAHLANTHTQTVENLPRSFRHTKHTYTYVPRAPAGSEPARFLAEWTRRRFLGETSLPISCEPDRRSPRPFLRSHLQFPLLSKCPAVSAGHASPRAPFR